MNEKKYMVQTSALAVAVVLAGSLSVKANITLQLTDATSKAEAGFVATVPTGTLNANELIGIYHFNASGLGPSTIWSTCVSPLGSLDNGGPYTYSEVGFSAGAPGHNPSSWATGQGGDSGIQNAQYLWRLFSPAIITGGNAAQGAGLQLAMFKALYDSTFYGVVGNGNFNVTTWAGGTGAGTAYAYYTSDLAALNAGSVSTHLGSGSILRDSAYYNNGLNNGTPTPGAGQDLIYNVTPVPEPTTIVAGALLLLPFGASTLRVLRRRTASAPMTSEF